MSAKRAKKTAKKTKEPEPFFRPFARLAADEKKKARAEAAASAPAPAPAPASSSRAVPAPASSSRAAPAPAPSSRAAPVSAPVQRVGKGLAPSDHTAELAPIDARTFAIYMSGVRALPDRAGRIPLTASRLERVFDAATPLPDLDQGARAMMRSLITEGLRFETTDDGDRIEGRRLDVDPRELRRLRRVQYAIDGKLDLHGHGLDDARRAVELFVKKRAELGDKVVAIVHGKGSHSPRQNGVLRGEIGAWLSQGRAARHVLAFATPPEDEGGTGAVLVLLAR